jgi:flagellar motility protein MotE (MotC chaperone)
MTLAEIMAWLEEHKAEQEVKDYLAGLAKLTPEGVKSFIENDDGKKLIKPIVDKAVTQGIDTWKTNNLDKLVDELHNKKYPPEDDRDKELREVKERLQRIETEKTRESLKATAIKKAVEKGLPVDIIDKFIGDDETATLANIDILEQAFTASVNTAVEKRFKNGGGNPPTEDKPEVKDKGNPWKKETFNLTEQGRILREDPEKAKRLMSEAGIK